MTATEPDLLEQLLARLDLQRLDRDLFLGDPGGGHGRLFGGLVAAQSLVAAARTVEEGSVHSLHAYFLRPGQHRVPIQFVVDRIRDGRTYTTRRVVAHQSGEAIFSLEASFTRPEDGISHQDPMPEAPGPEGLPDWEEVRRDRHGEHGHRHRHDDEDDPVESRGVPQPQGSEKSQMWIRPKGVLPEDPVMHAALLTYASDHSLLSTVRARHELDWGRGGAASLDHAMWFHYPPRWDDWILYTSESPVAHNARGLISANMYRRTGELVVSVAQEGLFRRR